MLNIDLDYYNNAHKSLLSKGAYKTLETAKRVTKFKAKKQISREEFLNYFLIRRSDSPLYATYKDRLAHIATASSWLDNVLDIQTSINHRTGSKGMQEQVGEAVSLSVAGTMFGLTAADWMLIPEQKGRKAHKTFDFERTMVGVTSNAAVIQIEAKGSFVNNNTVKQPAVDSHASNITKKKASIVSKGNSYKHPATARYGMIASIDAKNTAKCWLLDPPSTPFDGNAHNLKVANRLGYTAEILSLIAPKAKLPEVLMRSANEWREKQNSSSIPDVGRPFTAHNYVEQFLAKGKIWIEDRDIVGQLYIGEQDYIFFIGLHGDVIRRAIDQDGVKIAQLEYEPYVEETVIEGSPISVKDMSRRDQIKKRLHLHIASSGLVIGINDGR